MTHTEMIKSGLNDWAGYFRRKLTNDVATLYLMKIEPYSEKPIKLMFESAMQAFEPKAANFPSFGYIKQFLGGLEEYSTIEYNPDGDQRFPLGKLWEAFWILEKQGEAAFYNYCNSIKMPQDERQAVICKHKYNIKGFTVGKDGQ